MRRWPIFVVLLAWGAGAHAGDKVLFQPVPGWVKPASAPAKPAAPGDAPVTLILSDQQVRFERGAVVVFGNLQMRIDNAQGLAAGNISLPWRPDTGDLVVHRLVIHRGDATIDVIGSGQTFTVVRRETNLENAMLDGVLTANIQPEGLQVGDVLELMTSVTSRDPVLGGHVEQMLTMGGPLPIARAHVRASWPAGLPVRVQTRGGLVAAKPARDGADSVVDLTLDNLAPATPPKFAPTRYGIGRLIEMSDFAGWQDLGALMAPLFAKAAVLPPNGPLVDEVARIRAASSDPKTRATAALALVQDRVRYVALAMGTGGLVPADAATTWARRYGDCKAKTALLLAILHALDIAADPVVVSSAAGDGLDERLPAVGAFDHVLVRTTIAGKTYWLDGTRIGDTSLDRLAVPYFGWGLPLLTQKAALVRLVPSPLEQPAADTQIEIDATQGLTVPAPVKVVYILRGDDAVATNASLTALVGDTRTRALHEFWKKRYDFIDVDSATTAFDAANRELRFTMAGKARMDWSSGWYETDGLGLGYKANLSRDAGQDRDAPYAVAYPFFNRTVETIRLPEGFPGDVALDKVAIDRTIGGVAYRRQGAITDRVFRVEATERSIAPEFPARDATAVQAALREMAGDTLYIRKPQNYQMSDAELDAGAASPPTTVRGWLQRGYALIERDRNKDAIASFDAALKLDPKNEDGLANRGLMYAWASDYPAAERDLTAAEAINPRNAVAMRARGLIAEQRGDAEAAYAAYSKSLERAPSDIMALTHRAAVARILGKTDSALADIDRAIVLAPKASQLRLTRFNILLRLGRKDDAYKTMRDALVAADPADSYAHVAAARAFVSLGRKEEGMREFDRALAIKPEAYIYSNRAESRLREDVAGREADYAAAVRLKPTSVTELLDQAAFLTSQGRMLEAIPIYEKAVTLEPKNAVLLASRGIAYARTGRTVEAERDFSRARALMDKSNAEDLNNFCWAKATAGVALDSAMADCDAALALAPNDSSFIDSKGLVLLRLGRLDEAIVAYSRAIELIPVQSSSLYGRASLTRERGIAHGPMPIWRRRPSSTRTSPQNMPTMA